MCECTTHHTYRYIWLAQRFSKGVFVDLPVAFEAKAKCEEAIERCLVVSGAQGAHRRSQHSKQGSARFMRA